MALSVSCRRSRLLQLFLCRRRSDDTLSLPSHRLPVCLFLSCGTSCCIHKTHRSLYNPSAQTGRKEEEAETVVFHLHLHSAETGTPGHRDQLHSSVQQKMEDLDWKFVPIQETCGSCGQTFSRPENHAVHTPCFMLSDYYVDRVTGIGKSFRCKFCLMDYASLQGLVAHILFHFDKQYMCLHCHLWFYTRRTVIQHANHFHSRVTIPMDLSDVMELDEAYVLPDDSWQADNDLNALIEPPVMFPMNDSQSLPLDPHSVPVDADLIPGPSEIPAPDPKPLSKRAASNLEKKYACNHCNRRYKTHNGRLFHEQKAHGIQQQVISATSGQPLRAIVKGADGQVVASGVIQFVADASGQPGIATLVPTTDDPLEVRASESNETCELAGKPKAVRKPRATNPRPRKASGRKEDVHIHRSVPLTTPVVTVTQDEAGPVIDDEPNVVTATTPLTTASSATVEPQPQEQRQTGEVPIIRIVGPESVTKGTDEAKGKAKGKTRNITINGWVEGKVHHKEQGINNKKLHERPKYRTDQSSGPSVDQVQEPGVVRKMYCGNSRWKRLQEERERELRLKLADPKLEMECFVGLTDILKCYVFMQETERNGMTIYT